MNIQNWINSHLSLSPLACTRFSELYSAYQEEQARKGVVSIGRKQFAKEVRRALQEEEASERVRFANRSGLVILGAELLYKLNENGTYVISSVTAARHSR